MLSLFVRSGLVNFTMEFMYLISSTALAGDVPVYMIEMTFTLT